MTLFLWGFTLNMMSKNEKITIFVLRLSLGWIFLYSAVTKISNPNWSAAGFLKGAQTFSDLYHWLSSSSVLPVANFINEWGQLLLGVSLILGIGVRLSSVLGVVLMLLYYFPQLNFPYIGKTSYLVDEHIIYSLVLAYFVVIRAGRIHGLENWFSNLPICKKIPKLRNWLG